MPNKKSTTKYAESKYGLHLAYQQKIDTSLTELKLKRSSEKVKKIIR